MHNATQCVVDCEQDILGKAHWIVSGPALEIMGTGYNILVLDTGNPAVLVYTG